MDPGDICICGHIRDVHFWGPCSTVGCRCEQFVLIDLAIDLFIALKELTSAVQDGLRRHAAGDPKAIASNLISATLSQALRTIAKANS